MSEVYKMPTAVARRPKGRPKASDPGVGADELVRAACDLMRTTPPAALTWAAVGRHAGVNPSLYQYYFKSRPRLLAAAARAMLQEIRARTVANLPAADAGVDLYLRSILRALLSFYRDNPFFFALMREVDETEEGLLYSATLTDIRGLDEVLEKGVRGGTLRTADPSLLFAVVVGAAAYFATNPRMVRWGKGAAYHADRMDEEFIDFFSDLLLKGLEAR